MNVIEEGIVAILFFLVSTVLSDEKQMYDLFLEFVIMNLILNRRKWQLVKKKRNFTQSESIFYYGTQLYGIRIIQFFDYGTNFKDDW